jgi:hypothetical protein
LRCAGLGYTRPTSFLITWQPAARRQNASAGSANCGAKVFGIRYSAVGDLLVGADGFRSMVRTRLIPDAGVDDLDRAIYGKTPLTEEFLAELPEIMINGMPHIVSPDGISMGLASFRKREPFAEAAATRDQTIVRRHQ